MQDYLYSAGAVIVSLGGSSALIIGLSSWLGKVWAYRILEKDKLKYQETLEKLKNEYQQELEHYKLQLEKSKTLFLRYSEHQFSLYNDLYRNLCDLKGSADELWSLADFENLKNFSKQLKITGDMVKKSMLLIEDKHYDALNTLLDYFSNYSIGKSILIEIRNRAAHEIYFSEYEIPNLVNQNGEYKEQYTQLITEIGQAFKTQIRPSM
ncbi:MAG: hypothetical protein JM58_15385 [Peptococcaceae bacterium BICA1-8]|nr:MAG: hypothetical protein JM58_15385 [Peptococcaceae bacterium BICA1-8]